jgi:hypothetical protein
MKKLAASAFGLMLIGNAAALPLTGFYKTIDDETKLPKSIVVLYACPEIGDDDHERDELCGRIVALYDETGTSVTETYNSRAKIADKLPGKPYMVGLDIIYGMEWDDDKYEDGKILDPKNGKTYSCEIWQHEKDASLLNVRGKVGPFGRTQIWHVLHTSDLPLELRMLDTTTWDLKIIKK